MQPVLNKRQQLFTAVNIYKALNLMAHCHLDTFSRVRSSAVIMKKSTIVIYAGVAIGVAAVLFFQSKSDIGKPTAEISIPRLNAVQTRGKELFDANCSVCHGKNATGSGNGPSLVQKIYQPRLHADGAFFIAVKSGARAHHWQFGSMMPVEGVEKSEVALIVQYVRALQRANGIK